MYRKDAENVKRIRCIDCRYHTTGYDEFHLCYSPNLMQVEFDPVFGLQSKPTECCINNKNGDCSYFSLKPETHTVRNMFFLLFLILLVVIGLVGWIV